MTPSNPASNRIRFALRSTLCGLAGGVAWTIGIALFFGPAQSILGDPAHQSAKFLDAFTQEPRPRIDEKPLLMVLGLAAIGILWGWVYTWIAAAWHHAWWRRGLRFALLSWALMVPWFEFYLPWNVLREPFPLVALEMLCWAGVMTCVGLAIAGADHLIAGRRSTR